MQRKGGSGSKYVWYWLAVLVCYLGLTLILWKCITHEWGQMNAFDGVRSGKMGSTEYQGKALSQITTHVGSSGTGLMNKYFYRFKNVHIIDNRIKFYYDPRTFEPPVDEHWVDIVSCNATSPRHPTMFVIKGDAQPIRWYVTTLRNALFFVGHHYGLIRVFYTVQALHANRLHSCF
jgi:hypothetical protein